MALTTDLVAVSPIRAAVARRMQASKAEAPHFYVSAEIPMDRAAAMIERLNEAADHPRITLTSVLARACAQALRENPSINAVWTSDGLARVAEVNVSVAIALDDGLVAPAILDADRLDVRQMAVALHDLVERARKGKLRGSEMTEGTFTLSNLGMLGVSSFAAIVTPPQVAVLATGKIGASLRWHDGRIVPSSNLTATLSCDHRALDGVDAGRFLETLRAILERCPDWDDSGTPQSSSRSGIAT